jgi:serine/threonine protein phosphatase 1
MIKRFTAPLVSAFSTLTRGKRYSVPPQTRIYAIGDVHGCRDLLLRIQELIAADVMARPIEQAFEILVGDYVDRGADSRGVIDALLAPPVQHQRICLMGNHEEMLLDFLNDPMQLRGWRKVGGLETLQSYGIVRRALRDEQDYQTIHHEFLSALPPEHVAFLKNLRDHYRLGDYFFAHAGIRPGVPLDQQTRQDLLWIRDEFLQSEANHKVRVVHGHTPITNIVVYPHRIGIDTGAFATGNLSCIVLEGEDVGILMPS